MQTPINLQSLSNENKRKFKDSFDIIFTDCDGVLYDIRGVINNARETINELINEGKTIRYVTNNGSKSGAQLAERLKNRGFMNVTEESVVCPVGLMLDYFRDKLPQGKSVYVIGPQVICDELLWNKIHCFGPGRDEINEKHAENISKVEIEVPENVGAVVIELDIHINYLKILKAFTFLRNKDCLYVIMKPDETIPSGFGTQFPAAAAISAPITVASGRAPFLLGKPSAHLMEILKTMTNDPKRALFVGDNLMADILMGHMCSFKTVLVLTGVHNLDDVEKYARSKNAEELMYIPDFYTNSFRI